MEQQPAKPISFFISYAHEDEEYKKSLIKFLNPLIRNKEIEVWEDSEIIAGQKWDKKITEALDNCTVILFLVSIDFLASDYINKVEIKKAIEAAKTDSKFVVPILLRDCDLNSQMIDDDPDTKLSNFQGLPANFIPIQKWKYPDEAWMSVYDGIKKLIKYIKNNKA